MAEEKFLEYKGRPLVRAGKQIYYGSLNDPYVVYLTIKNSNELKDSSENESSFSMIMI